MRWFEKSCGLSRVINELWIKRFLASNEMESLMRSCTFEVLQFSFVLDFSVCFMIFYCDLITWTISTRGWSGASESNSFLYRVCICFLLESASTRNPQLQKLPSGRVGSGAPGALSSSAVGRLWDFPVDAAFTLTLSSSSSHWACCSQSTFVVLVLKEKLVGCNRFPYSISSSLQSYISPNILI